MSGDAVSIIADTLHKHYPVFDSGGHINGTIPGKGAWDCFCYEVYNTTLEAVIEHQSAAVVDALGGLERETATIPEWFETGEMIHNRMVAGPDMGPKRGLSFIPSARWVSGWVREPAEETP